MCKVIVNEDKIIK